MYGIIYLATNQINKKVYVGQTTTTLNRRRSGHYAAARNNRDKLIFHKAIRKYGEDNFTWEIIAEAKDQIELDSLEKKYIQQYNSKDRNFGYNMTSGGDTHSEQSQEFWDDDCRSGEWRLTLSEKMSSFWQDENNRKQHQQWMNNYYSTDQGKEQAKRHSQFMKEYYNGPDARRNKAKTSNWFVKATSPEGEEIIYISSKEPNLFFGKDIYLRSRLHKIGDVWTPSSRAAKEVQGWRFEAIEKFEI